MRRAPAASPTPAEQARAALEAVVLGLPVAKPGDAVERAFKAAKPREDLVELVARSAFALAAEGRGLVRRGDPTEPVLSWEHDRDSWPFGPATFEPALVATRAALLSGRSLERFGELEPDELGGFYEGLLAVGVELAQKDSVVVRLPRPAGGAAVDQLLELGSRGASGRGRPRGLRVPAGRVALVSTVDRRRSGSHYTPRALTERVVVTALGPLLGESPSPDDVLALRVADPALGTGAFLVAACRYLAERLLEAEARHGAPSARNGSGANGAEYGNGAPHLAEHAVELAARRARARRRVAERCLFGVDRDALAVEVARQALWLTVGDASLPLAVLERSLRVGEALLGAPHVAKSVAARAGVAADALDWERAFPAVFAERAGFDALLGNPPWVSYAGRAAQPLAEELRAAYTGYEAFRGYRNLQGLFIERCARLLRPGGRLGLVLPSSMSELAGYAPTRRAHDRYCAVDSELGDLGSDAFDGVFQPCMVLTSTRRATPLEALPDAAWPVERPDLDAVARGLIDKLARPPLPPHLFGERGLQSSGSDAAHLRAAPDALHSVPLRSGSDVSAFELRAPSTHADPSWFGSRLRAPSEWRQVRLLVRQTARVPVAALSDGAGFRNSLLAGFEDADYSATFLASYLNSTPIRWLHYVRHRDARQGMPQLKIAHLRATPSPPSRALIDALDRFGRALASRGRGILPYEQTELDALVADAFELDDEERKRLAEFRGVVADAGPPA
jgi:hypothetical protein